MAMAILIDGERIRPDTLVSAGLKAPPGVTETRIGNARTPRAGAVMTLQDVLMSADQMTDQMTGPMTGPLHGHDEPMRTTPTRRVQREVRDRTGQGRMDIARAMTTTAQGEAEGVRSVTSSQPTTPSDLTMRVSAGRAGTIGRMRTSSRMRDRAS